MRDSAFDIEEIALYLEYRSSGCVLRQRNAKVLSDFYDEVRSFYGALLAFKAISPFSSYFVDTEEIFAVVNNVYEKEVQLRWIDRPEEDIVKCAELATTMETDARINENKQSIEDIMLPAISVFSSKYATKLKTACAWLLRANLSSRGLDKVLESAITIEVLMGDRDMSDRIGLTKLIANRCAYALGKSSDEREGITKFFVEFY